MSTVINDVLSTKTLEDLQSPAIASNPNNPNYTQQRVEDCIAKLLKIEENNGYLGISQKVGLNVVQVKEVHKKMLERINELNPPAN